MGLRDGAGERPQPITRRGAAQRYDEQQQRVRLRRSHWHWRIGGCHRANTQASERALHRCGRTSGLSSYRLASLAPAPRAHQAVRPGALHRGAPQGREGWSGEAMAFSFGAPATTPATGGGLFGAAAAPATSAPLAVGGLFGAPAQPAASAAAPASGGLFGGAPAFGAAAAATPATTLLGAFTATPAPALGAFGALPVTAAAATAATGAQQVSIPRAGWVEAAQPQLATLRCAAPPSPSS